MDHLRALLHTYSVISFFHVRWEANKAADLLANTGVKGGPGYRCDRLEDFGTEEWAQHYRQLYSRDVNSEAQMAGQMGIGEASTPKLDQPNVVWAIWFK